MSTGVLRSVALVMTASAMAMVGCRADADPPHLVEPGGAAVAVDAPPPPASDTSTLATLPTRPTAQSGIPSEGAYLLTIDTPDTGAVAARVEAKATEKGLVVTSRPKAAAEIVAGWTGAKYAGLATMQFPAGVLVRWHTPLPTEGRAATGVLTTPIGLYRTQMSTFDGNIELHEGEGAPVGLLRLERAPAVLLHDYPKLVAAIGTTLREHFFDPAALEGPDLQKYTRFLALAASSAQDDLEFLCGAYLAAAESGVSHLDLVREGTSSSHSEAGPNGRRHVQATFEGDLATVRIDAFAAIGAEIDAAFDDVRSHGARGLVLDLRGNPGGDTSSLRVAAQLLSEPADAGSLFDAVARKDVLAGRGAYPTLTSVVSVAELDDQLAKSHAVHARVIPVAHPFVGPVAVLVDGDTASASEPLVALLQHERRARLFGAKTAGAMLSSQRFAVGDGWILRLPAYDYVTGWGARIEGAGVVPDNPCESKEALARGTEWVRSQL